MKLAAPAVTKKLSVRWEDENANTNVIGITPEGFRIRNIAIAAGRMFDAEEDRARRRVAVLGPTAAANLFGPADPVGLQIRIGRVPFEVIGLTEPKGMDANGVDQDDLILVPLGSAMRRLLNVDYIDTIYVQADERRGARPGGGRNPPAPPPATPPARQAGRFHDPEPGHAAGGPARGRPSRMTL